MNRIRFKALAIAAVGASVAFACGTSGGPSTSEQLAADQTLRFPIQDDVQTLDPGHVSSGVDITFTQEIFSGLYRFDNNLRITPDIATGMPEVSSDGKNYTFHMRKDAKFWNGDPITSKDVLYSWNRAAYLNDAYATVFDPVVGGMDTEAQKTKTMSGLTAPDDFTIKAQLTDPAGFWLTELALWTADVVDQKVIGDYTDPNNKKNDTWWTDVSTIVGSGPFKLVERTPKASMEFKPVANWYGGSTGALKDIKVDIGVDAPSATKKFEAGGYDMVGMADNYPSPDDILRYRNDPAKKKLETIYPAARSTWLGFNFVTGPFKGIQDGHDGRQSFARAISQAQLVDVACAQGATCSPATGGTIAKGLKGYLGDNTDPNAKFDAAAAKAEYQKWDPTGSKVQGLKLSYNTNASNDRIFSNVQSQLKQNLGISVDLDPKDFPTLIKQRKAKQAILFRDSWGADYDHPQDWFDNLFTCAQAAPGKGNSAGYCNPAVDKLVEKANTEPIDQSVSLYQQAQKIMINDAFAANLEYGTATYFTQPYVKGAGFNSLYDYDWQGIRLLKH